MYLINHFLFNFLIMYSSTLLTLLSLALPPLALTTPTAPGSAAACPTADFPPSTEPYFYLRTNTPFNPSSSKNNLYLDAFTVESGVSVAVLLPKNEISTTAVAFLNHTHTIIPGPNSTVILNETYLQSVSPPFFPTYPSSPKPQL